jgi:hydroxyethylthiazole kinase-like uncharacterized protein yjeF
LCGLAQAIALPQHGGMIQPVEIHSLELLTTREMAQADRLTIDAGTPGTILMEAAGAAVADCARAALLRTGGRRVFVACGPGNNGGDGFVAARILAREGFDVVVGALGDTASQKGDAAWAANAWTGQTSPIAQVDYAGASFGGASVAIDALFGAGLTRDLDGPARDAVERLNAWRSTSGAHVIAVDVPSGLDGDSGQMRGLSVVADETVTFFRLKPGHLLLPGRALCGRIVCAQIGIDPGVLAKIAPRTFANEPDLWRAHLPAPRIEGHKYARGHALVLSGPLHRTGAARLAARGALRGGAGLVTLCSPREALAVNAAQLTAIMLAPCDGPQDLTVLLADRRLNALVLGPGGGIGEPMRALVLAALAAPGPRRSIILDADALTSFEGRLIELAEAIKASQAQVVLTPHDGEFARLFSNSANLPKVMSEDCASPSRLDRARAGARLSGAVMLLKGADSVVAHPDGRAAIHAQAPPWLATAGSGDVLAGLAAACLAQGAPAFEGVCAAVWLHGAAARAFGPGLIAEDLPEAMPGVWRALWGL